MNRIVPEADVSVKEEKTGAYTPPGTGLRLPTVITGHSDSQALGINEKNGSHSKNGQSAGSTGCWSWLLSKTSTDQLNEILKKHIKCD